MSGVDDAEQQRRKFKAPYTPHNPIPTIQSYREEQKEREAEAESEDAENDRSSKQKAQDAYRSWKTGEKPGEQNNNDVYPTENQNANGTIQEEAEDEPEDEEAEDAAKEQMRDTSETQDAATDPKDKRKQMKKRKGDRAEREVTDPVTHLPIKIHDFNKQDLDRAPENISGMSRSSTGLDEDQIAQDAVTQSQTHRGMQQLFPSPDFMAVGHDIAKVQGVALTFGLAAVLIVVISIMVLEKMFGLGAQLESKVLKRESAGKTIASVFILLLGAAVGAAAIYLARQWTNKKVKALWDDHVWEAERQQGKERSKGDTPESTQWLCELLSSVWPLVNPDLFTSLADTLEDVMQASLPRLVRMVSVEDIGQGSESVRILGIKWLPTGAASRSVTSDGKLQKKSNDDPKNSDRSVPGQGEIEDGEKGQGDGRSDDKPRDQRKQDEESDQNINEGMEAEEGDFVNMEIAFSYRARADGKGIKKRAKNAHLYLAFYLPGNIKFPVWVELQGLVGVMRLRLQLTPDPPFFSLCTLTFLGQPKVDASCVPLTKRGLNVMDLPVISNFVQSAIDAAIAEYVAPKSLTLDLKEMLIGDDFKKDTSARGVLVVKVKRAFDFKEGDAGFGPLKKGSSDAYVSAGWAKFGKPVWSTRIIVDDMHPSWEETAFILVTPEELNVRERLRLQLWDSDRMTADDDLGRIELDIKDLMKDKRSNGAMWDREDGFRALKAGEGMPGKLCWSVGYFSKTRILEEQLANNSEDPDIKSVDDLKRKVDAESERKLREAKKDESSEVEQQKAQDLKEREDNFIIAAPPPRDYPSGILSIVIHQITGLELEAINKNQVAKNETASDETEEGEDLPSSYCTIILNHQKAFRTRTKPKNGKPFFNAGCERFIRDWRTAEIMVSVRDARVHEDDALLGIVMLPLRDIFKKRSQVNGMYPLSGGVGYGKCRISMVFRSVQLQSPREMLGWDYGTLDIKPDARVTSVDGSLNGLRIKVRTSLGKGKFHAEEGENWRTKSGKPIRLAVRKRYSSPLIFEFRSSSALLDKTPAFAVLWMKDIPDEAEKTFTLPIWKGDLKTAEKSTLDEYGENVGQLEFTLKFWHGLSGYHGSLASKDNNIADVMEVLDCAQDNDDTDESTVDEGYNSQTTADSSDDEAANDEDGLERRQSLFKHKHKESDLESDGKRGPVDQLKDYTQHRKELHRRNRGLMQWKGPRTIQWAKNKVKRGEQRLEGLFGHHERGTGIETEV
jgi:hypothetical protein